MGRVERALAPRIRRPSVRSADAYVRVSYSDCTARTWASALRSLARSVGYLEFRGCWSLVIREHRSNQGERRQHAMLRAVGRKDALHQTKAFRSPLSEGIEDGA